MRRTSSPRSLRITPCQRSGSSSTTEPSVATPTLLSSTSSRPQRSTAAATMAWQPDARLTSASKAAPSPPCSWIISTVRSASFGLRSTTRTRAPARARSIAAARPLPIPSPTAPPPVTIATLPRSPGSSGVLVNSASPMSVAYKTASLSQSLGQLNDTEEIAIRIFEDDEVGVGTVSPRISGRSESD